MAWGGKPAAILGASVGPFGSVRAQNHLRDILSPINMYTVNQPEVCIGDAAKKFDAQRNLTDEKTKGLIGKLVVNLVEWTRRIALQ